MLVDLPGLGGGEAPDLVTVERALHTGSAVAAAAVTVPGDMDGLPFASDLDVLTDAQGPDVHR